MRPNLGPATYIFVTTKKTASSLPLSTMQPKLLVQETAGLSIVTTEELAISHGFIEAAFRCKRISLTAHFALFAVNLIATMTNCFKDHNISTHVISGFYHNHLYVAAGREEDAMQILKGISECAREELSSRINRNV